MLIHTNLLKKFFLLVSALLLTILNAWGASAFAAVSLTSVTPSCGQAGITNITLLGSGFPSGAIPPASVTITLTRAGGGSPVTTAPRSIISVSGTMRKVSFIVPSSISVQSPTVYSVSLSGTTSTNVAFASSNSKPLTINPPPSITLSPAYGEAGQSLQIEITGTYTNFSQGVTAANFGPGISVGKGSEGGFGFVRVNSPTSATANITIDPRAETGTLTITVQTGSQQAQAVFAIVIVDAVATAMIGPQGGNISVQNHLGDNIILTISAQALIDTTSITIKAVASPLPNPIANNVYPGAILEPSGLVFSLPVDVKIDLLNPLSNPNVATLISGKNLNATLLLANQTETRNSIEGQIYHFSPIIVGEPSIDELETIANLNLQNQLGATPIDIIDDCNSLLQAGEKAHTLGNEEVANKFRNSAKGLLEQESLALLNSPLPQNPCGLYSNELLQLSKVISTILDDSWLAQQIAAKACTLNISPHSSYLFQGYTGQFTAQLLDSNGKRQSCSTLNWYSNNVDVADIELTTGNTCVVKAHEEGSANISANCGGLLGYASVGVIPAAPLLVITSAGCSLSSVPQCTPISGYAWGMCQATATVALSGLVCGPVGSRLLAPMVSASAECGAWSRNDGPACARLTGDQPDCTSWSFTYPLNDFSIQDYWCGCTQGIGDIDVWALGVPGLPRPGSGKKIRYSRRQAFEMLTTMILEHGGFTPRLAISAAQDLRGARQWADDEDVYALLVTARDGTAPEQEARLVYGRFVRGEKELLEALKELGAGFFLNVSALERDFENALAKISGA